MASLLATLAVLLLAQVASSRPGISFPLNSQLPPAARPNEFFSYSFSPSTFTSDFTIEYSLGRHPAWLFMEASKRRLYGTPRDSDVPSDKVVDGQEVDIIATDHTGSAIMTAVLVVSRDPSPSVKIPLIEQIARFGQFSAPSSVLFYPSTDFEFSFNSTTFGDAGLNHYATSGDRSPLPAWIKFNNATLTFSGTTPPFKSLVQPPQAFDFLLIASEIVGFSAASISFSIVVGSHKLTADKPIITLDASWGSELTYTGLENSIKIDDKPAAPGDLKVTTNGLPAWLSYDAQTSKLQGTPRQGDHSTNFTISFHDPFSDTLDVLIVVNVASNLFKFTLDDMEARPGGDLQIDLAKYFRNPDDVDVEVTTKPDQDWLKVNRLGLFGQVPRSAKADFEVSIRAASRSSDLKEVETFKVVLLALDGSTTTASSSISSPTAAVTRTQTPSATADADDSQSGHLSTVAILLATIIPIIFITVALMLLICFFRRRRTRQTYLSSKYRAKISNPVAGSFRTNDSDPSMREFERMGGAMQAETQLFKPGNVGYAEVNSQSSRRRSSETYGDISDPEMPRPLLAEVARAATIRSVGDTENDDARQSWVTVAGEEMPVAARSNELARSHRSDATSDTTLSESTHQLLPTPLFLSDARNGNFRSGLDMSIPTLEDLPSVQATPTFAYRPPRRSPSRHSLGGQSATTSSSAVLPYMFEAGQRANARNESNWETIAESEAGESISELRKPDKALLSSRPGVSKQWYDVDSSNGSKSLGTETSFASSENWRVIGQRNGPNGPSASYRSLVDRSPVNDTRPDTAQDDAEQDEGAIPDPLSPSRWGDDVHATTTRLRPSRSVVSMPSDFDGENVDISGERGEAERAGAATWNREPSGVQMSEGSGSFQVFL